MNDNRCCSNVFVYHIQAQSPSDLGVYGLL